MLSQSMPGKPQNPNSWFYGARLRAGFRNAASLAERLGVPKGRVYQWERGNRPANRIMPQLAVFLNVTLHKLVEALYRETLDDPCPCGCGGRKALSDSPTAHKLVIKLPCAECGKERTYPQGKWDRHRKFCEEHRVKRTPFTCIGYSDHNATRYARDCPGTIYLRPSDVNARQRLKERFPTSRFDLSSRTYQCNSCAGAERLLAAKVEELKELLGKKYPHRNVEKIRSRRQRLELLRAHHSELSPNFKATHEAQELGRRRFTQNAAAGKKYPEKTKANLLRRWSGDWLPKGIRFGICIVCKKLIITMNSYDPRFHKTCHQEWERTSEGGHFQSLRVRGQEASLATPKPGRPVDKDALAAAYGWAVQYYFGNKSYRQIAKENDVDFTTVRDGIGSVVSRLPEPKLVAVRFQPDVQLLLAASDSR